MELSEIPRDILDRLELQYQQEQDSRNKNEWITGLLKSRYIGLRVVQTIKSVHRELDGVLNRHPRNSSFLLEELIPV